MPQWDHLLDEEVAYQQVSGRDNYGDPTYGDVVTVPAAVQNGFAQVRDSDGIERTSSIQIVTSVRIGEGARVWIPGDDRTGVGRLALSEADDKARRTTGARLFHTFL